MTSHQQDQQGYRMPTHAQCGSDLLDGVMAKLSDGIPHLLKKSIILHNTFTNGVKQSDAHLVAPPKIIFWLNRIINKVAPHQLVVPSNPLPL
jgi:hypothetical protein